jgi:preprotein translocase subunit SecA
MIPWLLQKIFGTKHEREIKTMRPKIAAINDLEPKMREAQRRRPSGPHGEVQGAHRQRRAARRSAARGLRHCREAGRRVLNMRHFDVQLIGGMVLHRGAIAEMKTGEGKTLVATLPEYLNALSGKGVHIVTVNDYLASATPSGWAHPQVSRADRRAWWSTARADREKQAGVPRRHHLRQNNEFGFDYLRDNMK